MSNQQLFSTEFNSARARNASLTPEILIGIEAVTSHASRLQAKLVRILFQPAE